ncbi:hypothetical protein HDU76_009676 [Blyttiomyces sp. JEL0837]|nr:hypothetical protein HDU76_009676 [Blyttiomyces sp. JEL0837]
MAGASGDVIKLAARIKSEHTKEKYIRDSFTKKAIMDSQRLLYREIVDEYRSQNLTTHNKDPNPENEKEWFDKALRGFQHLHPTARDPRRIAQTWANVKNIAKYPVELKKALAELMAHVQYITPEPLAYDMKTDPLNIGRMIFNVKDLWVKTSEVVHMLRKPSAAASSFNTPIPTSTGIPTSSGGSSSTPGAGGIHSAESNQTDLMEIDTVPMPAIPIPAASISIATPAAIITPESTTPPVSQELLDNVKSVQNIRKTFSQQVRLEKGKAYKVLLEAIPFVWDWLPPKVGLSGDVGKAIEEIMPLSKEKSLLSWECGRV